MKRAVLYLRLSKEDEDKIKKGDDSESIINQRLLLTDYALEKGFQIVDVYSDDDYSGLYDNRPEFDRLIRDSKLGKFDIVLSKSQSRFTRNMEHMEKYLHHDFPLMGIRFIGVVDGTDTEVRANKKTRQINGLVNEWYCEDLSENIKAVFHQKMKAGQYIGAFAPYGYLKDPKDHHKFIIDEEAADVVRWIYNLFLQGYSIKEICSKLEEKHILCPTLYKESQGLRYKNVKAKSFNIEYNLWSPSTVKRILENETYIGKLLQGRYKKVSYKDKKVKTVPKEEWIVAEHHHEPIITEEAYLQVQQLKHSRRRQPKKSAVYHPIFPFLGKIKCQTCGSMMIKSGKVKGKEQDWYLRCQLANRTRLQKCSSHNIRSSLIERAVRDSIEEWTDVVLKEQSFKEAVWNEIINHKTLTISKRENEKQLKEIEDKIEEKLQCLKSLYQDRVKKEIIDSTFFSLKEILEQDIDSLKKQKKLIYDKKAPFFAADNDKINIINNIKQTIQTMEFTYEIINDWIDSIEVCEKQKDRNEQEIIIHWNL